MDHGADPGPYSPRRGATAGSSWSRRNGRRGCELVTLLGARCAELAPELAAILAGTRVPHRASKDRLAIVVIDDRQAIERTKVCYEARHSTNRAVILSAPPQALAWRIAAGAASRMLSLNRSASVAPEFR